MCDSKTRSPLTAKDEASRAAEVARDLVHYLRNERGIRGIAIDLEWTLVAADSQPPVQLPTFLAGVTLTGRQLLLCATDTGMCAGVLVDTDTYSPESFEGWRGWDSGELVMAGPPLVREVLKSALGDASRERRVAVVALNPALYRAGDLRGAVNILAQLHASLMPWRPAMAAEFFKPFLGIPAAHLLPEGTPPSDRKPSPDPDEPGAGAPSAEADAQEMAEVWRRRAIAQLQLYPPPGSKEFHLRVFAAAHHLRFHEVCLIDDSAANVACARRLGCLAIHVTGGRGLQTHHLVDALRHWRQARA